MATTIDRLQIEINAQSKNANMAIDNLIAKISKLSTSLSSVNSKGSNNAVKGLKNLSNTGRTARNSLDNIGKLFMHCLRQLEAEIGIHDKCHATLTGL